MPKPEMIVHPGFIEDAAALEKSQQTKLWRQLDFFLRNPSHPSLGRKKVHGTCEGIWEFRVDDDYRVIYQEPDDQIPVLLAVRKHDEALRFAERWRPPVERRARPEVLGYMTLAPIPIPTNFSQLKEMVASRKYYPLSQFLSGKDDSQIQLSFSQIEQVIGSTLPPSARRYRAWWGNERNSSRPQSNSWLEAGWQVAKVRLEAESVTFIRLRQSAATR